MYKFIIALLFSAVLVKADTIPPAIQPNFVAQGIPVISADGTSSVQTFTTTTTQSTLQAQLDWYQRDAANASNFIAYYQAQLNNDNAQIALIQSQIQVFPIQSLNVSH